MSSDSLSGPSRAADISKERKCEKCGGAIGEIQGHYRHNKRKHYVCTRAECNPTGKPKFLEIRAGERTCDYPGCSKTIPAGLYPATQRLFFCSTLCFSRYTQAGRTKLVACAHCGTELRRNPGRAAAGPSFCPGHYDLYRIDQRDRAECGPFLELYQLYLRNFASVHYEDSKYPRHEIRLFFAYLTAAGVADINQVLPAHIDGFLTSRRETKGFPRADYVKRMFEYLIELGTYRGGNPVLPRIHYMPAPRRNPRPYDEQTRANLWRRQEERGDARAKFAVALGEESGPRGKEVCNIRLSDLDRANRRIWIRNPTKNKRAGWILYGEKTERWLEAWLSERPEDCGHDYLLTNAHGGPLRTHSLRRLLNGIFCCETSGSEGLETFSFHALRHVNSTLLRRNGVDAQSNDKLHRWDHFSSQILYTERSEEECIEQYERAMDGSAAGNSKPTRIGLAAFTAARRSQTGKEVEQ